jgi:hypothetical protein
MIDLSRTELARQIRTFRGVARSLEIGLDLATDERLAELMEFACTTGNPNLLELALAEQERRDVATDPLID